MDHHIDTRHVFSPTPLFLGLILTYARYLRQLFNLLFLYHFRFVSDGMIEYNGFRAVYNFIPNPLESIPFISKCEFEIGGATDYIGSANISEEHVGHATQYGVPVDCTWVIR